MGGRRGDVRKRRENEGRGGGGVSLSTLSRRDIPRVAPVGIDLPRAEMSALQLTSHVGWAEPLPNGLWADPRHGMGYVREPEVHGDYFVNWAVT